MKQAVLRYQEVGRGNGRERQALIEQYLPLVRRIAFKTAAKFPGQPTAEELVSTGVLGLIDAVDRYDPSKGKSFAAYAELRIRGAILDELRKMDSLSRQSRRIHRKLENTRREMSSELGRVPTRGELADRLGVDEDTVIEYSRDSSPPVFLPIESLTAFDERKVVEARERIRFGDGENPYHNLLLKEMKERALEALKNLPERLQVLMSLYYAEDMTYKQIARVLNVTESRVCQMHTEAVATMRKFLEDQETDSTDTAKQGDPAAPTRAGSRVRT